MPSSRYTYYIDEINNRGIYRVRAHGTVKNRHVIEWWSVSGREWRPSFAITATSLVTMTYVSFVEAMKYITDHTHS